MPTERTARETIGHAIAENLPRPHPDYESELASAERYEVAGYITDRVLSALEEAGYQVGPFVQMGWYSPKAGLAASFHMAYRYVLDNHGEAEPVFCLREPVLEAE